MQTVDLEYGLETISVDLPDSAVLVRYGSTYSDPPAVDPVAYGRRALDEPLGMAPLTELAGPGKTAAIVGLHDRGVLRAGAFADVLVFDPKQVRDHATFEQPYQRATGFDVVLVNGAEPAQRRGRLLRRRGRPIR